jgi:hypothetical protein
LSPGFDERAEDASARITGAVLITLGLGVFLAVFLAVFPVLQDPVASYDHWFPATAEDPSQTVTEASAPRAGFQWVAEGGQDGAADAAFTVSLRDRSEPGDTSVTSWVWDLGDGSTAHGRTVEHEYASPGDYLVSVAIEDEDGSTDIAESSIFVPEQGREEGQAGAGSSLDLTNIEASAGEVADSVVDGVRAAIVIGLFALAALVLSMLGWRLTRAGALLLRPAPSTDRIRRRAEKRPRRDDEEIAETEPPSHNGTTPLRERLERAGVSAG